MQERLLIDLISVDFRDYFELCCIIQSIRADAQRLKKMAFFCKRLVNSTLTELCNKAIILVGFSIQILHIVEFDGDVCLST